MKKIFAFIALLGIMVSCTEEKETVTPINIKKMTSVEAGNHFTAEVMHRLGKVSDPQVSPDGKTILFGISYTSIEENKGLRNLYLMDIDGSNLRQLTNFSASASNARWIDGGKKIAYLQKGKLFVMNADGTGSVCAGEAENGIGEFKFSPDGTMLIYSSDIKSFTAPTDVHPDLEKATVRVIDDLMYRHWDHFVETIPHTSIASFDGNKIGKVTDILEGEPYELPTLPFGGLEQLSWSPDGKFLAYSCRKLTGVKYTFSTNTDIYIYSIGERTHKNITEGMMGYDTNPAISPDGTKIAWMSMERDGYEADKVRLFVSNIDGSGKKELSANFKYNVDGPVWTPDSKEIYFASLVEGVQEIWKSDLNGVCSRVSIPHEWFDFAGVGELLCNSEGVPQTIITTNTSMQRPAEIISMNVADGTWKQLTHENDEILANLEQITIEERWIKTTDGGKMLTWVLYPANFDKSKVYPSILICLGGPQGTLSQGWSTRWNYRLMASQGYIVVLPNRHGTTAFGQEWCEQISGDYCGQNMRDYFAAADALKAEPFVGKMAAMGASYGGYSIYNLAGIHNNRFSAFVAHAGIFNQDHMYMETEEMWFPNWDNGGIARPKTYMSGSPWSDNPIAKRHYANSPHLKVPAWNTPIMVTHGELDYRVPVDQGMAAFNAAQMMGVPSKMLLFPDENHWILKPQNSVFWHREVFNWLDKWCK
ncbi:MAG: S9 family peptidase [Bacteroidales bacterium]|nr:S9 family peptidase [Bacteroidales bacterium]